MVLSKNLNGIRNLSRQDCLIVARHKTQNFEFVSQFIFYFQLVILAQLYNIQISIGY